MLQDSARLQLAQHSDFYLLHAHMQSLACLAQFAQVLQMDLAQHSAEKAIQLRLVAAPPALIVEIEQIIAAAANAPVASAVPPVASDARAQEKAAAAAAAAAAADQSTSHDAIKRSICCTSELYAAARKPAASWMRALSDELASSGLLVTLLGELAMTGGGAEQQQICKCTLRFRF